MHFALSAVTVITQLSVGLAWALPFPINGTVESCSPHASKSHEFDFFLLVANWPKTVCDWAAKKEKCVIPETNQWTIHGLWPNNNDNTYPQYCSNSPFNESALDSLQPRLSRDWPNLFTASSEYSFWQHEWERHGSCAMTVPSLNSEQKYFKAALDVFDQVDIYGTLAKAKVVPQENVMYQVQDLMAPFTSKFGATPYVGCFQRDHEQHVYTLTFCIGKDMQVIDCPRAVSYCATCHADAPVYYLPLHNP